MTKEPRLVAENLGPITKADVRFGDLTVIVGPQASGKSIFLQALKLAVDRNHIHDTFLHHSVVFNNDAAAFLGAYFGRGMGGMLSSAPPPTLGWNSSSKPLLDFTRRATGRNSSVGIAKEKLFYIPAQRVVSLPAGNSRPFGSFEYGDPYVLRYFADQVHLLLQNEFASKAELFPASNRLNADLRSPIENDIFGGARLEIELKEFRKTLSLKIDGLTEGLTYLAWSAGQREFVPLLLGLYWLCPAGAMSTREPLDWVVLEEPEMGLHPRAIVTLLLNVLELMRRGYRVVVSTHSPVVLDFVWAVRIIQEEGGGEADIRKLFQLKSNVRTKSLAEATMQKSFKVFFFERGAETQDISSLDPGDDNETIASWGGLTAFASRTGGIVADVVNRPKSRGGRNGL